MIGLLQTKAIEGVIRLNVNLDLLGLEIKEQADSLVRDLYNELKNECETYDQIDEKIKKIIKSLIWSGTCNLFFAKYLNEELKIMLERSKLN